MWSRSGESFLPPDLQRIFKENKNFLIDSALQSNDIEAEIGCLIASIRGVKYPDYICTRGGATEVNVLPMYDDLYNRVVEYRVKISNIQLLFHTHPITTKLITKAFGEMTPNQILRLKEITTVFSPQDMVAFLDMYIRLKTSFDFTLKYSAVVSYIEEERTVYFYYVSIDSVIEATKRLLNIQDITSTRDAELLRIKMAEFYAKLEKIMNEIKNSPVEKKDEYINQLERQFLWFEFQFNIGAIKIPLTEKRG